MAKHSQGPFKIGIDARFFRRDTGGIGRYTRELLHHLLPLDRTNEYVIFITPDDVPEFDIRQENVRSVVVPALHFSRAEQVVFLQALLKEKLDLVHFLNFNHPVLYRRPFVTTLHDLTLFFFPAGKSKKSFLRRKVFQYVFKRSLHQAKKVVAISEYSAEDAQKSLGLSHAHMEVIYEGGPDHVEIPFGSKKAVTDYIGCKEPYFLFVSQWRPHKGLITLVQAFNEFKQRTGLPHKLVLAGKQQVVSDEIRTLLTESPFATDIIAPGFVPDELLPLLYHHATAFVMPSEYEGFGLPVLEAYACATAVICARNSSLPEVGGPGACYFETGNTLELAGCLNQMATDETARHQSIVQGQKHMRKFSWATCAQRTLELYRSILE